MVLEAIRKKFEGPSWSNRIIFYFCLFSFLLLIFLLFFIAFTIINSHFAIHSISQYNSTELSNMGFFDNERYLISALVQSLAATIALVITLSLVAVQLAAQSYSSRVIDIYKNNPDMWILIAVYIFVIFYGLAVIKFIEIGISDINMEFIILSVYFLGLFAFICLVPYIRNTLNLLKPSTVINLLSTQITKENVLRAISHTNHDVKEKDPVQPIIDMVNSALLRNDYETVRNGLTAITNSTVLMFETADFESIEDEPLSDHILTHVERLAILAIKNENEDSAQSAIQNLETMGFKAAEKGLESTTTEAVRALGRVGTKAAEKGFITASIAVNALRHVGIKAIEKNFELTAGGVVLISVGGKRVERRFDVIACIAVYELERVGIKAVETELGWTAWGAVRALESMGTKAVETELDRAARSAVYALGSVGTIAAEKGLGTIAMTVVGTKTAEKELETIAMMVVRALESVGTKAFEKGLEQTNKAVENELRTLLEKCREKEWNEIVQAITEILEKNKNHDL